LRKIYNSLKDGMSVAADWFELPTLATDEAAATNAAAASRTESVKSRMRGKTQETAQQTAQPAEQPTEQPATGQQGNQEEQAGELGEESHAPFSYAEIAAMLIESENAQELDEAADLIGSITDPQQRQELVDVFNEKREQLSKPARRTRGKN
jgi:hypothetical protein